MFYAGKLLCAELYDDSAYPYTNVKAVWEANKGKHAGKCVVVNAHWHDPGPKYIGNYKINGHTLSEQYPGMAISGMVPVTFSPFAYAVLPMSMSPAVAVASIVSGPVVMSRILSAKSLAFIGAALPSLFLIALAMAVRFSDCTLIAHRPFRLYVCYQPQVESFMIATNQSPQLWCRRLLGRPLSAHV